MLTPSDIQQANDAVDALDTSGLRRLCMCCGEDLPDSNPHAVRVTHGICQPLCEPAIELGWGNYKKAVPTKDNPLAPLIQLI